jgi:hypothetical protein
MQAVGELEAERVLAGLQFDGNGCLALAVVEVPLVGGDDLSGGNEVGVDEDVEMSCAVVNFAGGLDDESGVCSPGSSSTETAVWPLP